MGSFGSCSGQGEPALWSRCGRAHSELAYHIQYVVRTHRLAWQNQVVLIIYPVMT